MNYNEPSAYLNRKDYTHIVSIGNKCPTAMILRELQIYKQSFPFDYVPTTPSLILRYLKDPTLFFPKQGEMSNADGVRFEHFNTTHRYHETIQTFQRRFHRLQLILSYPVKKKILFVYSSEADVYNEMGNRYLDNYSELYNLQQYLETTYPLSQCTFMMIHTNRSFSNTPHMFHYTINVPDEYLSDDMSTHQPYTFEPYRRVLKELVKCIFRL